MRASCCYAICAVLYLSWVPQKFLVEQLSVQSVNWVCCASLTILFKYSVRSFSNCCSGTSSLRLVMKSLKYEYVSFMSSSVCDRNCSTAFCTLPSMSLILWRVKLLNAKQLFNIMPTFNHRVLMLLPLTGASLIQSRKKA